MTAVRGYSYNKKAAMMMTDEMIVGTVREAEDDAPGIGCTE